MRWLKYGGYAFAVFVLVILIQELVGLLFKLVCDSETRYGADLLTASLLALGMVIFRMVGEHRRVPTTTERWQLFGLYVAMVAVIDTIVFVVARVSGSGWLSSLIDLSGDDLVGGYWISLIAAVVLAWPFLLILPAFNLAAIERREARRERRWHARR